MLCVFSPAELQQKLYVCPAFLARVLACVIWTCKRYKRYWYRDSGSTYANGVVYGGQIEVDF